MTARTKKQTNLTLAAPPVTMVLAQVPPAMTKPWMLDSTYTRLDQPAIDKLFNDPEKANIRRTHLRNMMQNDVVAAAIRKRKGAVQAIPLRLEGANGETPDTEEAAFIMKQLNRIKRPFVNATYGGVFFGYGVVDLLWENEQPADQPKAKKKTVIGDSKQQGRVSIKKIMSMKFEEFKLDINGKLITTKIDKQPELDRDIEAAKLIYFVNLPSHDNPYGESLLADIYVPWLILCHVREMWAKSAERFGQGFLKGKVSNPAQVLTMTGPDGEEVSMTALQAMVSALDSAQRGASVVHGKDDDVGAIEVDDGTATFEKLYDKCEANIYRLVLGQNLTSGQREGGSLALGRVLNDVRLEERDADIDFITPELQKVVNALWRRNEFAGEPPNVLFAVPRQLNQEQATRDSTLLPVIKDAGLRFSDQYLHEQYGLDDQYLIPIAPTADPLTIDATQSDQGRYLRLGARRKVGATEAADGLTDEALARDAARSPIDPALLLKAVRGATSPEDLDQRLERLLTDPANKLAFVRLQRDARVAAQVMGLLTAATRTN